MRLKGKTALIAGASRNIGGEIAVIFAREGADVILVARKISDDLKRVAKECVGFGVQALPLAADVGDHEQVNRAVQASLDRFGTTQEVANVALLLASDESSFVTGDRIVCAGERYM